MARLHAEFTVGDYGQWKTMFENDPAGRQAGGVRSYQISRGVQDPDHVLLDMDFDDAATASAFLERLRPVWASAPAGAIQSPTGIVVESQDVVRI